MFSRCLCLQSSNRSQASLEVRAAQTLNSPMEIFIFSFEDVTWYVLGLDAQTRCDMVCFGGGRATDYLDPVSQTPSWQRKPVSCFWPQFWCQRFVLLAAMTSPKLPDIFNRISLFVRFMLISFACNLLEQNSQTLRILKWFNATAKSTQSPTFHTHTR